MDLYYGTLKSVPFSISCQSLDVQDFWTPSGVTFINKFSECRELRLKLNYDMTIDLIVDNLKLITDSPLKKIVNPILSPLE